MPQNDLFLSCFKRMKPNDYWENGCVVLGCGLLLCLRTACSDMAQGGSGKNNN